MNEAEMKDGISFVDKNDRRFNFEVLKTEENIYYVQFIVQGNVHMFSGEITMTQIDSFIRTNELTHLIVKNGLTKEVEETTVIKKIIFDEAKRNVYFLSNQINQDFHFSLEDEFFMILDFFERIHSKYYMEMGHEYAYQIS